MKSAATKAKAVAAQIDKKYGHKTGAVGSDSFQMTVVPTGSLALDYALGTGGWPLGHPIEVFGAPDIGKSSVIGFQGIKNAQAMGLLCGIIALEPSFDPEWAYTNGVDPDAVVIARPDTGEIAFQILHEWMKGQDVDFVVFDSIGAIMSEIEQEDGAKSRVGGQSKLITDGVKRILMPTWKHNKGLIFLNQQRDDMNSRIPGMKTSPGGNAVHHSAAIRVWLKQAGAPFKTMVNGEEMVVGKTMVAKIMRNKLSEGSDRRAEFDFYQAKSEESVVGIDSGKDIVTTAIRTGVIEKAGGYYRHDSFPPDKKGTRQLQGKERDAKTSNT
jgi:recombination protein RecA